MAGEDHSVAPATANDRIGARAGQECVVAHAALQEIAAGPGHQRLPGGSDCDLAIAEAEDLDGVEVVGSSRAQHFLADAGGRHRVA